jgi:hypothetical protein
MLHPRVVLLSTICTAFVCCAGAVQLTGVDRLADAERSAAAAVSTVSGTSGAAAVALRFKSETFPLER